MYYPQPGDICIALAKIKERVANGGGSPLERVMKKLHKGEDAEQLAERVRKAREELYVSFHSISYGFLD